MINIYLNFDNYQKYDEGEKYVYIPVGFYEKANLILVKLQPALCQKV